jgi:outer membrane protein assembly factor BamD
MPRPRPDRFLTVLRASLIGFAALGLVACSDDDEPEYVERPVEELYNTAMDALEARDWTIAMQNFEEVDRQHPYSVWATKAQLMAAYSNYMRDRYDEAIIGLERFIELHPGNEDTPYAYYLIGLSYYEQISDIGRDQKMTQLALTSLEEVVRRFPQTPYARDARLKVDLARDHLAGKEVAIGRFYQARGEHLAAINRFRVVVEQFQTTTHVPEALHRIVESYLALGVESEARMAASVLGHNFPGSEWYSDSFVLLGGDVPGTAPTAQSWYSRVWNWVF